MRSPLRYSALMILPVVLALSLTACGKKDSAGGMMGKGGPAQVGYIVVKTEPVTLTQELSGRTSAWLVADVRPQVGGIVKARQFTEGALVSAGQSLYQIDSATFQATAGSADAAVAQAQAAADAAAEKAGRYQQLIAIKAISQQDYDDAQTAAKTTAAALAVARANAQTAHINLNYTRVTAPISGRIGKSTVTPGALVTANQTAPLATIQDLSKIYVDITQSASDLLKLKKQLASGELGAADHADVTLVLDDGSTYPLTGRMQFSDVTVSPTTGSVALRAVFANPDGLLLPGMYVRARIAKGTIAQGIRVPQGGVILDPKGGASVLLAGEDGKAHSRKVVTGDMIGPDWQILSGLKAGDKVIVEGAMRLKDKGPIKPYAAKAAAGSEAK